MSGASGARAAARTSRGRVLVVDDEEGIRDLLQTALRFAGYDVDTAATGREAVDRAARGAPDLVVLDVMLPDADGFALLPRLRARSPDVPVLFLTARGSTEDKVRGLGLGGDDYVTKPFSLAELAARIEAVLRRGPAGRTGAGGSALLAVGDLELDEDSHQVRRAGRLVELSPTEFRLLRYLLVNAGRVLSKAQILDHVWAYDFGGDAGIVESYVSYLRRKLDDDPHRRLLHTVRGVGYVLRLPAAR